MTDSIDVAPSDENGNVPLETPSEDAPETVEPATEETPAGEEGEPVAEAEPAVEELFELPDGRKVDAGTLQTEWKENFAPEFTRKSQELADLKKENLPEAPKSPYADPDYVPENYQEIIEAGKQAAIKEFDDREATRVQAQTDAENAVVEQLDEIKKIDSSVDENKLFLHANKYGFRDLKQAHQNMQDMSNVAKTVQKNTVENIAKRNDPVSVAPGGATSTTSDPSAFSSAQDFLRSLT